METTPPMTAAAREDLEIESGSDNWKTGSMGPVAPKAIDADMADRFDALPSVETTKRVSTFKDLDDNDDQESKAFDKRDQIKTRAATRIVSASSGFVSNDWEMAKTQLASPDISAFPKAGFAGAGFDPLRKLGGIDFTTKTAPRPTDKASPDRPIASLAFKADLVGEYYRPNAILISPHDMETNTSELAQQIFVRCHETIKAVGGYAISEKKRFRLRGNVEYGYEASKFELQVHMPGDYEDGQLVVNVKRLSYSGRSAFNMLLQKIAWDLKEANLADKMADGTDILRPMVDLIAMSTTEDEYTSSDELDDLAPPSMLGTLGLSSVVTNRRSGRRRPCGIRLDKDENNDLVRLWRNMLDGRERHDILKTIAHCSEDESNAKKLGESDDLMKQIIEVLGTVGIKGERDQQSIHCALAIIENVLKNLAEFVITARMVEVLVENLLFYLGLSPKTAHVRSEKIQDAAVESLNLLFVEGPKRTEDGTVTPTTMKKLEKVMSNKTKIKNQKTQENLERVYRRMKETFSTPGM